jgi:anti-sigma regulatory factor (Ser/Thr protein kinase)
MQAPKVRLELGSRPECVSVVRAMLAGVSEHLGFDPELLADLKMAVSEACNNVVVHAYGDGSGPLIVELACEADGILVTVRDCGAGMPAPAAGDPEPGLGKAVMNSLTSEVEFRSAPGHGTEARMRFAYRGGERFAPPVTGTSTALPAEASVPLDGAVMMAVEPVSLLASTLGRLAGAVAAQAYFPIDRYSDLYLVTDDLAAHACSFPHGGLIGVALSPEPHRIELRVGPFQADASSRMQLTQPGGEPLLLELQVEAVDVQPLGGGEQVHLVLVDPQPPTGSERHSGV